MDPACNLRSTGRRLPALAAIAWLWASSSATVAGPASGDGPALLTRFCGDCHTNGADEGGVALDGLLKARRPTEGIPDGTARQQWVAVWKNLRAEIMPSPRASGTVSPAKRF